MNKTQTEYGKLPKYKILYKWITDQIYNGTFKYMEKLPSESELCNQFQISRQTVRNAFQELETDGLISRSKGSGSFVAKEVEVSKSISKRKNNWHSFYQCWQLH